MPLGFKISYDLWTKWEAIENKKNPTTFFKGYRVFGLISLRLQS